MVFDYNVLDNIQLSDDEDDTHPNIDTPSLFRMRHRHRLERQAEMKMQIQDYEFQIQKLQMKIDAGGLSDSEFRQLAQELDEANEKLNEVKQREVKQGLDIDHFVFKENESKAIFAKESADEKELSNLLDADKPKPIPDEYLAKAAEKLKAEKEKKNQDEGISEPVNKDNIDIELKKLEINKNYASKHKGLIFKMFRLKDHRKLKDFLFEHPELIHEGILTFSLIKMVDYQYEDKLDHVKYMVYPVTHLKFILELISTLGGDKKKIVTNYFQKFQLKDQSVINSFNDQVNLLLTNAEDLAEKRRKQLIKEDMEERRKHLNGEEPLDPNDVINELPEEMVQCFVKRDTQMLQDVIAKMDPADAAKYMSMCVRAGLWNPGPDDALAENIEIKEETTQNVDERYPAEMYRNVLDLNDINDGKEDSTGANVQEQEVDN